MSLRALLGLLLLLAVVVGLLFWLGRGKSAAPEAPADEPLVPSFQEAEVHALRAACGDRAWTIERSGEATWRMAEPVRAEADPRRVHEVIAAVQDARVRKVVQESGYDARTFALDPGCRLEIALGGEAARLVRLGRTSPVGTERYAVEGRGRLVLTDGSLQGVVDREPASLLERRLFPFEPEAATRLVIETPGGRTALQGASGEWRIVEPVADVASAAAVSRLASALSALEVAAASETPAPTTSRADRRIAFTIEARGLARPLRGFVAAAGVEGRRIAWREDGSLAGLVAESALHDLGAEPGALRDKRVATFGTPDVRSVVIERAGARLRIERASEGAPWEGRDAAAGVAVDPQRVDALLDRLRNLHADGFVDGVAPSPATGTITVAGGEGELVRLSWGPLDPGTKQTPESVWVTAASRPGALFRVPATALGPVPAKASDLAAASSPPAGGP